MHIRLLALAVLLLLPAVAAAEDPAPGGAAGAQRPPSPDFLFAPPKGSVSLRWTVNMPRADSDWFGFVREQLTLDRGDFTAMGLTGDVSVTLTPRADLVIGGEWTGRSADSEYRDFVDDNRLPIRQTTRLRQFSLTGGVRYALAERGRSVSTLSWIPTRVVPYVTGGAGVLRYSLMQYGEFIDIVDFSIFPDQLPSDGWTPTAYVGGGVDWLVFKRLALTLDGRYQWASPNLDESVWTGFEPLDLGGARFSTGFRILY
jgi:hypothetical protein